MGVIAYTFFYGDFPYVPQVKSSAEMKKVIREGTTLPSFQPKSRGSGHRSLPAISKQAEALVRALLDRSKDSRIVASDALQHNFILNAPSSEKLPSLQTTFRVCLKCGAFENRPVDKFDGNLDPLLDKLHSKHTGFALVQEAVKAPAKLKVNHSTRSDASTAASSDTDSAFTVGSNAPDWKTSNMSVGGCHQVSHSFGQPI
jgi:serine/threonine protein kinase